MNFDDAQNAPFDAITASQLRAAGSLKWTLFPEAIGMFIAEMDFGLAPAVAGVLERYATSSGVGYLGDAGSGELRAAAADWFKSISGFRPDDDAVFAAPDVVSSARMVIEQLSRPGSPVVLPTPAYMAFRDIIPQMGRELIEVPSPVVDGRYVLNLDGIRAAFERGAGTLLLVNPWNPTGRVLERAELEELAAVVADFPEVIVYSDEIHAPLVLEGRHVPFASVSEAAARQTVTATAATKGWNMPGLKSAQLFVTNPEHRERMKTQLHWAALMASTIGAKASVAAYREGGDWLADVAEYVRANRDLLEQWAAGQTGVSVQHIEGTYIGWLDFTPAVEAGLITGDIAVWLRKHAGVALTSGASCGVGYENFARMIIATPRPILKAALAQISAALQG